MLSWLKRIVKRKPKSAETKPKISSAKKPAPIAKVIKKVKEKKQVDKDREYAVEAIGEYVHRKGHKAVKEFNEDMGIKKKTKRLVIPRQIEYKGIKYSKYTSYGSDLESAKEAAQDMKELGYNTRVAKFQRGSWPEYVVYRYKKGMPRSKPKNTKKVTAKNPTTRKTTKKWNDNGEWCGR